MAQDPETDEGQLLREHVFAGDLLQLPAPEEGTPDLLPEWFSGSLPVLVYPPLSERGLQEGENVNLEVTPFHIYYGALRELAETADAERAAMLRRLALEWNESAALEVCQLGRAQIEQDVETALLHYELALELDETLYEAAQDGGMCEYALAAGGGEEAEERLESAEELFRRAIELRPEAGLSWWSLARVLFDQGEAQEASASLRRFLQEQPQGADREMVEETLRNGFYPPDDEDEEEEEDELAGGAEQEIFMQAQALTFGESPDPAQAVALLAPLAEEYPDSGEVWFVMGAAYRRMGESGEAERCLRRAARLSPDEQFVWWELSRACADAGQWRPAEEAIRKALESDPDNPIYFCDLGRSLLKQGDREGAREAIEHARALVPDDPEVLRAVSELNDAHPGRGAR
jgi:tetratricopeptide (TPR) repeat protein